MSCKVAFPFRTQEELVCAEAKKMLADAGFELICNTTGRKLSRDELKMMISDAFAVIAGTEQYDEDILSACRNLKVIVRFGVGTDNFDLETMKAMGIQVGVIANYNAVAEFALTLILATLKSLPRYDASVRRGEWNRYPMFELSEKTVGILGFGRIGRRLAELLSGFGTKILVYDPYIDRAAAEQRHAEPASMDELLSRSDIISLHMPSNADTFHIIDRAAIAKMKDGAFLINTARGALVDESALDEALRSGKLSAAGLDVFENEPAGEDNPLIRVENCVLAPHVSALSRETNYNGSLICARSVIDVSHGKKPVYPLW